MAREVEPVEAITLAAIAPYSIYSTKIFKFDFHTRNLSQLPLKQVGFLLTHLVEVGLGTKYVGSAEEPTVCRSKRGSWGTRGFEAYRYVNVSVNDILWFEFFFLKVTEFEKNLKK